MEAEGATGHAGVKHAGLAHVAIIMDGNGRWATERGLPRAQGHQQGARGLIRLARAASELGIGYLTLYGFSMENWDRPGEEVDHLMALLRECLQSEIEGLQSGDIRFRVIGDRARLAPDIRDMIADAERMTAGNAGLTLVAALSYGARDEIVRAARAIAQAAIDGQLDPAALTEAGLAEYLFTTGIPDPDLLIRTGGEKRISNFLLWQCAYTEFVFVDRFWPDFTKDDLEAALAEFHRRERRYGGLRG